MASRAIEDFKVKVGVAINDTYLNGLFKCKAKVFVAFSSLNLRGIMADDAEEKEEEGSEAGH